MNAHYLYMKFKYMLLAMLIVGSVSCSDEEWAGSLGEVESGIPVNVKLNFSAPKQDKVVTSRVADYAVNNLYVIVCNENGSVAFSKYYKSGDLNNGTTGSQPDPSGENNWVMATIPTGQVGIYAFANVEDDAYPGLKNKLDGIATTTTASAEDLIKSLKIELNQGNKPLDRPGQTWVMSGACSYTVTQETTEIKIIKLRRLDSIITFNITSGGKCTVFKARRWYIMNAPASTYVVEHDADRNSNYGDWDASNDASGFYHSFKKNEQDLTAISANTFTFYMPENRKVKVASASDYQDREKQVKDKPVGEFINGVYVDGDQVKDRSFTCTPEYGTYVVITGTYEGTADSKNYGQDETVTANVVYKIHLGYVGNNANDFFSERNTKYTYNVTVTGVDNIVLEVETDEEKNPGATGEVLFTEGDNIYTLDAHYENVLLTFSESELEARSGRDAFRCIANTPFTSLDMSDGSSTEVRDVDWVHVMRNKKASTDLQEYPGDGSTELQSVDDMLDDLYYATHSDALKADYTDKGKTYPRDISNLFTNGKVTYTCYVDEFYYDKKPAGVKSLPEEDNALWKHFVNRPNRLMYIVCNTTFSKDGESSIVSAKYILSQRSIQTIYTTDTNNGLITAYGIETVNESGQLPSGGGSATPTDQDFGWKNTWKMVDGNKWSIINHSQNGYTSIDANKKAEVDGMNNSYKKTYIACMQRNRKTKGGDYSIDKGELKWYLPALHQYQAIYVGESGINEEAWLYNFKYTNSYPVTFDKTKSAGDGGYKHYQSSTYKDGSAEIIWSEESASNSTLAERSGWNINQTGLHIRCARNLGTVTGDYQDFKTLEGNVIGVPYLNSTATDTRRGTVSEELGEHYNDPNYVDGKNDPSNNKLSTTGYFEIYTGKVSTPSNLGNATGGQVNYTYDYEYYDGKRWKSVKGESTHPKDKYSDGQYRNLVEHKVYPGCESISVKDGERKWRTPNLREFTLMGNLGVLHNGDVCRTKYYYSHRAGWFFTAGIRITMGEGFNYKEGSQIRCVRDCDKP